MTHYIGNLPLVGKKKTQAFTAYCENCQQEKSFYWVKPYNRTIIGSIFGRLFCLQNGLTIQGMKCSFHTILMLFKIRKNVEIGQCEQCGQKKVRCRYCGYIEDFNDWQETYVCPKCNNKSYIIADHPQPTPWYMFEINSFEENDSED